MSGVGFASGADDKDKKAAKGKGKNKAKKPKPALPKTFAEKLIRSENPARIKKYAANRMKGMNKADAAREAGFPESMAKNVAQRIERPNQEYFRAVMDKFIPDELLALKTLQGLDATTLKFATFNGEITDVKEFADMPTRAKYIEIAAELKGRMVRNQSELPAPAQVNVIFMGRNGSNSQLAAEAATLVVPVERE